MWDFLLQAWTLQTFSVDNVGSCWIMFTPMEMVEDSELNDHECISVYIYEIICMYDMILHESYIYIYTYIHTYMHACTHARTHACIHPSIQPTIHPSIHTYIHTYIHTCIHTYIHTYIHRHTYTHTYRCRYSIPQADVRPKFNWLFTDVAVSSRIY